MKTYDTNIYIGESATDNWNMLENASNDSYWYHLKCFPSAYVICDDLSKASMCAKLCKQHSKFRNVPKMKIVCTQISNLIKGDTLGSVCFKSKRKLTYILV